MISGRAPQPISTQSRPSPADEGKLTACRSSTYPSPWIVGLGGTGIHTAAALGHRSAGKTPMRPAIAHRWASKPRVLLDCELRIIRANRRLCRAFGVLQGSLAGTQVNDWINIDPSVLDRLRDRIGNGSVPWHVILRLRLSGSRVLAVSQILRPLRSGRSGYLLISLAGFSELKQHQPTA